MEQKQGRTQSKLWACSSNSEVAHFPPNHLLARTLIKIVNRRETGKKIVLSYKSKTKSKKNPSIEINEEALKKEESTQYPVITLNTKDELMINTNGHRHQSLVYKVALFLH